MGPEFSRRSDDPRRIARAGEDLSDLAAEPSRDLSRPLVGMLLEVSRAPRTVALNAAAAAAVAARARGVRLPDRFFEGDVGSSFDSSIALAIFAACVAFNDSRSALRFSNAVLNADAATCARYSTARRVRTRNSPKVR